MFLGKTFNFHNMPLSTQVYELGVTNCKENLESNIILKEWLPTLDYKHYGLCLLSNPTIQ